MEVVRVEGGARLEGEVTVPGAKNSALKLMAAALLAPGGTVLHDVPDILDVTIMAELLRRLGCRVEQDAPARRVAVDVPEQVGHRADYELVRAMRASISVLGPLLARVGEVDVALPGGDAIGSRGLDLHVDGLRQLGAEVDVAHGYLVARAPRGLRGALVPLAFPSVGATENLLTAAVLAEGTTVLDNAAREPEVVDLARMLSAMGARIEGVGTSQLRVEGVARLRPVQHRVVPDRIVAGTWAYAAAAAGGDVHVRGARAEHLGLVLDKLTLAGVEVVPTGDGLRVLGPRPPRRPRAVDVATLPYPGFPTDLQPFALVLGAVSEGSAVVTENLFEARFRFVPEIARLGADVRVEGHHVLVRGRPALSGAPVEASDIRAGAALVVAGLVADGVTEVSGVQHLDRGYDAFVPQLAALGARVERVQRSPGSLPLPGPG
ncbi:UDP-N-acetylglucosamine 1-carboxyvinyltransferase [Quadrisphaera sp. DSM 44207]|uniref:UDP-N-acetylglucosamine 1-carboxyvinyltransferase n=1 Tax=Quadrisphaera sp. DSM 44207 TaxID=1881057 RepID=UPI00087E375C|nr:UDP-N-acetylglucosamine 1-carboxyvinyltransferase [Quadrisphaera sp. DSM 44207]SDQ73676.1 UDP-N-acetylglucosamine 1-carboxyvinyltransferase [Quadrisphaera sp. DSM 44207]